MKQNEGPCACRAEKKAKSGMRWNQRDGWKPWLGVWILFKVQQEANGKKLAGERHDLKYLLKRSFCLLG